MDKFWKNKKIIAYIALLHHTRFIIPIMERLKLLGANVQYVVGQAERSQEITAVECNLNYKHVFSYLSNDDFNDIQKNYLRERKIFSKALTSDFAMATQMVTVLDKTLYSTAQEYVAYKNLLKYEKPDLCFALHEANRWGKMFAFWSKKFNTPFITLQEGLGYNADFGYIGHVQYSTLDLVWGERIRKKLSDFEAPVERIIPVGNTHLSREKKYQKKNKSREKIRKKYKLKNSFVNLLIFSAKPPSKEILLPLLKQISLQDQLDLILKFHPACKYEAYLNWQKSLPEKLKKNFIFIHGQENTYDLISACDLCILAQPSTTGIEAVAFEKPLIQLDIASNSTEVYSFVDQKVAVSLTPEKLAKALAEKKDFNKMLDPEIIKSFLKNELTDTEGATDRIVKIMKKVILANQFKKLYPLDSYIKPQCQWSFIIPVPENSPNNFLLQLNAIAEYSEKGGEYEVILIIPDNISPDMITILDSLEGDVLRLSIKNSQNIYEFINNHIPEIAKGENILLFSELIVPCENWLSTIDNAFEKQGSKKIFGCIVENQYKNIIHAGVVLNTNNSPVSAYEHLDSNFPQANKERSFQILDHFLAIKKELFLKLGGFWPEAGVYAFMDLSLRFSEYFNSPDAAILLPELHFIQPETFATLNTEDSINFFSRWHGRLWDSEDTLYKTDKVSTLQIESARLTRAIELTGR